MLHGDAHTDSRVGRFLSDAEIVAEYRERKRVLMARQRAQDPEKFKARSREWNRTHPDRRAKYNKESTLKSKYGISLDDYNRLYKAQGGCCAICQCPAHDRRNAFRKYFCVDHDHESNAVRGLLCSRCNAVIEDAKFYGAGLEYLQRAATSNVIMLQKVGGTTQ